MAALTFAAIDVGSFEESHPSAVRALQVLPLRH